MKKDIQGLLSQMTLEEKASLCSGADFWKLKGIPRLGIPSLMVTDGPHGLRKNDPKEGTAGLGKSVPATCFPTASALGSSWNRELMHQVGQALGEESKQEDVAVILGPGINIKRSPLCGRNFEYLSEDPFLGGELGAAQILGTQSQGVGTSLKHFAVNNQETRRMVIDALVDDRALREIYLAGFEIAVKKGQPYTVMCSYNRLNGEFCSEDPFLLTQVLKEEWGHEGLVITDWGAANQRVAGLAAGLELEMPGNGGVNDAKIVEAVKAGKLEEKVLDEAVRRNLELILKTHSEEAFRYDAEAHHQLARRALGESAVLLKNEGVLPLAKDTNLAVLGAFAKEPRYQGSGSSLINPSQLEGAWEALNKQAFSEAVLTYAPGYGPRGERDQKLLDQAVEAAKNASVAVIFAGLPPHSETEGLDRETMAMPLGHTALIKAVAGVNPSTVVVLSHGAPVEMPWIHQVPVVLDTFLGGQAWGLGAADLLYGDAVPSGKLSETYPLALEDVSATPQFPGGTASTAYTESIYVGYRYYDTASREVLFPFGHGLSYTTFVYDDLNIGEARDDGSVEISFSVKNTGRWDAKEVVQVYVGAKNSTVFRPLRELKGFEKTALTAGEKKTLTFTLDRRAFAYWDSGNQNWCAEAGEYTLEIGASSRDIRLTGGVLLKKGDQPSQEAQSLKTRVPHYFRPDIRRFADRSPEGDFAKLYARPLPPADLAPGAPIGLNTIFSDIQGSRVGAKLFATANKELQAMLGPNPAPETRLMMESVLKALPMRNLGMMSGGKLTSDMVDALILMMNGRFFKGFFAMQKAKRKAEKK